MEKKLKVQVVVILQKSNSHYLLLLKTNEKRGGFWQNVTGSVEIGEEIRTAALREFQEETGIILEGTGEKIVELNKITQFLDRWGKNVEEHFFAIYLSRVSYPTIQLDDHEHDEFKWVELDEVKASDYKFDSNFMAFTLAKEKI